jgi:O-acetylhomoserine (thiol)-lyase
VFYCETTSNPSYSIPDFDAIAKICKEKEVAFVVDNTFGMCGFTCRPIKFGANVIVSSCTKWIGG